MIFKLHYWFLASGLNAVGILLGVFIENYTDASPSEIGLLYMLMPFTGIIFRPIICSLADREQAHQKYLIRCQFVTAVSYFPFVLVPFLGPQFYKLHPRLCWYTLVSLKVIGDIALGGTISIGDSLAINYSKRLGVDFSVYRVWGTISWMVFGMVIGQINEVWFLPKYVPGFLILISASLLDLFCVWLWPKEYFEMVSSSDVSAKAKEADKRGGGSAMMKSLMPREVVWAHAKGQLRSLATCSCLCPRSVNATKMETSGKALGELPKISVELAASERRSTGGGAIGGKSPSGAAALDRRTQIRILLLLLRRDLRIVPYLLMFVCAGFSIIPISFFFMSLSQICHQQLTCDFSQLGGFLQVSMAIAETILFIYIKRIIAKLGRLNTVAISFLLTALKYTFYATLWNQVDPHFALISELPHGVVFGIYLTLMVEMGHLFASEVEHIIPELQDRGLIGPEVDCGKLKLSLAATMQSLIASANDGIGRGVGALIFGLILDKYSYQTLWWIIGIGAALVLVIVESVNLLDYLFKFRLGLDVAAAEAKATDRVDGCKAEA